MKEYIEREAAKKAFCRLCYYQYTGKCKICPIDAIPAADVVEVVRCSECEYWDRNNEVRDGE